MRGADHARADCAGFRVREVEVAELFGEAFVEGEGGGFGGAVFRKRAGSKSASRFGVQFEKTQRQLTGNSVRGLMISRRRCDRLRRACDQLHPRSLAVLRGLTTTWP
jgi:hypothetical protein